MEMLALPIQLRRRSLSHLILIRILSVRLLSLVHIDVTALLLTDTFSTSYLPYWFCSMNVCVHQTCVHMKRFEKYPQLFQCRVREHSHIILRMSHRRDTDCNCPRRHKSLDINSSSARAAVTFQVSDRVDCRSSAGCQCIMAAASGRMFHIEREIQVDIHELKNDIYIVRQSSHQFFCIRILGHSQLVFGHSFGLKQVHPVGRRSQSRSFKGIQSNAGRLGKQSLAAIKHQVAY
mmetsp:Transcript_15220/g.40854  ORF Transcript_15220/g.40854 Transcript_15220/m.40854 type:complete len:234 (+) Transcript_15220:1245-1946(+)